MESESTVISFWQALPCSKSVMFAKVTSAMFLKAFCVKKPWWPVMITLGKVSNRVKTSSWIT